MRVWLAILAALTLLTVGPGATAGTSDPPHNGLIAARGADGIYLVDAQTMKSWKVPGTADRSAPTWSPDGSRLAVEGWDENGDTSVYTIKPDGSDQRLVLQNAWSPSWSPDGKRLVVVRDGCGAPSTCDADFESAGILVTVRVDGSDVQEVTVDRGADSGGANEPEWSPDGKWIAFFGGNGAVNLVSPDGADDPVRTITSGSDSGWNLAWSPDASKLAFDTVVKAHDYRQEIAVFDFATDRLTTLPSRKPISALTWSPDGKQFAFLSSRPMPESSGGCGGEMPMDLWAMGVDGSKPHRLSKGSYARPSWGRFQPAPQPSIQVAPKPKPSSQPKPKPSSQAEPMPSSQAEPKPVSNAPKSAAKVPRAPKPVAVRALGNGVISARGSDAIYLIGPGRGDVRKIPGTAKMAQPAWSPDGSLLAVEQADAEGRSVYTIRPDGSHPQLVLRNASAPSWSADGKRLYVQRKLVATDDGSTVLMSVRLDGTDAREVDVENEDVYDPSEPAVPPDGNWIGFFADKGPNPASFDSSAAAWSPDAKQLAFVSVPATGADGAPGDGASSGRLWVVAADGGKPPQLLATGIYGRPSWRTSQPQPRSTD